MIKICVININAMMRAHRSSSSAGTPLSLLRTNPELNSSQFPDWRPALRVLIKDMKFGADDALAGLQVDQLLLSNSPVLSGPGLVLCNLLDQILNLQRPHVL